MFFKNRREFLNQALFSALSMSCLPSIGSTQSQKKYNVVFFYIDDLGWKDTGYMGSDFYETPNIDRIAREGMIFTNAYANAPNCAPSRACLLTGQYTPRHGVYTVGTPERGQSKNRKLIPTPNQTVLDPSFTTIPEIFKQEGYATAHMGKWHLGEYPENGPKTQGYDVNIGGFRSGSPPSYFSPYNNPALEDGLEGEYLTERLGREGVKFIESNQSNPFFLMMSLYAVHTPLKAKENLVEKYKAKAPGEHHDHAVYAAMIEGMDHTVGRVLDAVDECNLTNDTMVIFYSDNGGYGPATSMHPLRGAKGMMYEGGIRVPMAIRWPRHIEPNSVCDTPVIGVDWMPTFLELLNRQPEPEQIVDGESMMPLLHQTGNLKRDAIYWHFPAYLQAYQGGYGPWRTTPAGAIRKGNYKLIEYFEDGQLELYDLKNDIGESNNLAEAMPEKRDELYNQMKGWRNETNAPVPDQLNPEYENNED